jgi:hypothetical protein
MLMATLGRSRPLAATLQFGRIHSKTDIQRAFKAQETKSPLPNFQKLLSDEARRFPLFNARNMRFDWLF